MNSDQPSLIRAVRGPILLILLGVLFVMDQFTTQSFWRLWPVLIIVYGVLKLMERVAGGPGAGKHAPPRGVV